MQKGSTKPRDGVEGGAQPDPRLDARRSLVRVAIAAIAAAAGLGACRSATDTTSTPPTPSVSPSATVAPPASAAASASNAPPAPVAATLPTLYPLYEGACGYSGTYPVGNLAVHVFSHGIWALDGAAPRLVYVDDTDTRPARWTSSTASFGAAGGIDEAHMWVVRYYPARGEGTYGGLLFAATGWKPADFGSKSTYELSTFLAQPDGSLWAFGAEPVYGMEPSQNQRFFAWSPSGSLLHPNLPGRDMQGAERLESGELVAAGRKASGMPILRRWSPTKRVDDLPIPAAKPPNDEWPRLRVGTARAVVAMSRAFYVYENEAITPSPMNGRAADTTSWLVTKRDELVVTKADGTVLIDAHGAVTEERAPEPGKLADESSAPWLIADSGALYMRFEGKWTNVPIPSGPWTAAAHTAIKVESVAVAGGETFVTTVRTDVGFGRGKAGAVRTVYGSRRRPATLRCGAPFASNTIDALPPAATSTCTSRLVVIGRDTTAELPKAYPKIGAALKGDASLGDTLAFVSFGAERSPVLAIAAPTSEVATALVTKLGHVASHAPEVVCGTVTERRRLSFDVKSGAFAAP